MMSNTESSFSYWGTGRRKTAIARVRLVPGNGKVTINGRSATDYLNHNLAFMSAVTSALETLGLEKGL